VSEQRVVDVVYSRMVWALECSSFPHEYKQSKLKLGVKSQRTNTSSTHYFPLLSALILFRPDFFPSCTHWSRIDFKDRRTDVPTLHIVSYFLYIVSYFAGTDVFMSLHKPIITLSLIPLW